jgi:hypothetical protein
MSLDPWQSQGRNKAMKKAGGDVALLELYLWALPGVNSWLYYKVFFASESSFNCSLSK